MTGHRHEIVTSTLSLWSQLLHLFVEIALLLHLWDSSNRKCRTTVLHIEPKLRLYSFRYDNGFKELENLIMVLVVNFTVARAPDSFRANYDTRILERKLLYGQFNCFAT